MPLRKRCSTPSRGKMRVSVGCTDLSPHSCYLFTPAVKRTFHLPPCLRIVTPLHQGVVMGVLQRHFVLSLCCLLQPVEVAVGHSTWRKWSTWERVSVATDEAWHGRLPSSRSGNTRKVVSSFRFLLNSMESSLIRLEVLFISWNHKRTTEGIIAGICWLFHSSEGRMERKDVKIGGFTFSLPPVCL